MVIEGKRGVGRPRMTWVKAVESDMRVKGLMREDAEDRTKWRAMSWGAKGYNSRKNSLKTFCCCCIMRRFISDMKHWDHSPQNLHDSRYE